MYFGLFRYRSSRTRQDGYILLVLMLMAAILLISLSLELPAIGTQIRRDRENELIHRGAQYARAIKRYYKKFGAYPVRVEQLENTNNIRFLRKKYKDPMTGQDFRLLHFGDVQLSLKSPGAATGPGIAPTTGGPTTSSPFGASRPGTSSPTSITSGPTFGGGPIIGVASTSEKASLHVFNEKDHYKDWEFIYDPTQDRGALIRGPYNGPQSVSSGGIPGAVAPGQIVPGQPGQPVQQPQSQPFGNPAGGFGQPGPRPQ